MSTTNVLVVYATNLGNTEKMAQAVVSGAQAVHDTKVLLKKALDATHDHVRWCDALLLGSPVRHRTAHHEVKIFIENVCEYLWLTDEMVGKVGGVFSVGGGYGDCGAGAELAQLGMLAAMAASGMILVTFPKSTPGSPVSGLHWGPHGRSGGTHMEPNGVTEEMRQAAWHHGANVARVAAQLKGKDLLAKGNVDPPPDLVALFQGKGEGASQ